MQENKTAALAGILSDIARDRYRHRCREMAAYIGHEVDFQAEGIPLDVDAALAKINIDSHLQLDGQDQQLLGLVLNVLAKNAKRFGDDPNIPQGKGENSTTHAIMSVILSDRLFDSAGIAKPGENEKLQRLCNLGVLIHDAGEALGEFSTNNMHFQGGTALKEQGNLTKNEAEYHVLNYVMTKAAYALSQGTPEAIEAFKADMQAKREELDIVDHDGVPTGKSIDPKKFEKLSEGLPELPEEWAKKRDQWMGVWHMAEYAHIDREVNNPLYHENEAFRSRVDGIRARVAHYAPQLQQAGLVPQDPVFAAHFIKAVDKLQGTRHFKRFWDNNKGSRTSAMPAMDAERVEKQLGNCEKTAGNLFIFGAQTPKDDTEKLARSTCGFIYETNAELCAVLPPLPVPGTASESAEPVGPATSAQAQRRSTQHTMLAQHWWSNLYSNAKAAVLLGDFTPEPKQFIFQTVAQGKPLSGVEMPPAPNLRSAAVLR